MSNSVTRVLAWFLVAAALLMASATRAQTHRCHAEDPDCFVEEGGTPRSARRLYRLLHEPREPHHLRAFGLNVSWLTIGTTWYWLAREKNLIDWDRPSAKARFTADVIRMDNNDFPINFTLHPWSGSAYYVAARTSGLSFLAASGYSLGSTLVWEYGIEFREKVSFNDLLFTPLPGISIGEFFSKLMLYVNRPAAPPSPGRKAVAWLVGPLQAFSDVFDSGIQTTDAPADNLGYSSHLYHRFRAHAGVALQSAGRSESVLSELAFDGALIEIPSYLRRGRFRRFLHDADFTRLWLSFVQAPGEREFDSYADVSLFGMYEQHIDDDLRGGSVFLGTALGYRARRSVFPGFQDDLAVVHLPGLAVEAAVLFGPRAKLLLSYRLTPDFAGLSALAYESWQAAYPEAIGKTVVAKEGYLYAFGISSLFEGTLELPRLTVGGRTWFGAYNSVEGLDRSQETLTADPKGFDRALDYEAFLRMAPLPWPRFTVELSLLGRRRISQLGGFEARASLLRTSLRAGVTF